MSLTKIIIYGHYCATFILQWNSIPKFEIVICYCGIAIWNLRINPNNFWHIFVTYNTLATDFLTSSQSEFL